MKASTRLQLRRPRNRTVKTRRPFRCGRVSTELPYLAGGPARSWHLVGSTPIGCRGFNGPVPPPLLISALQLWANYGPARRTVNRGLRCGRGVPFDARIDRWAKLANHRRMMAAPSRMGRRRRVRARSRMRPRPRAGIAATRSTGTKGRPRMSSSPRTAESGMPSVGTAVAAR